MVHADWVRCHRPPSPLSPHARLPFSVVFSGAFSNTGQICCAIKRTFVHESIYDEFVEAIATEARKAKMGDGFDPSTEFGPLNNAMQFEKVKGIVEDARASGARIVTGGKVMDGAGKGYFYEPTIIADVKEGVRIVDEEQVSQLKLACPLPLSPVLYSAICICVDDFQVESLTVPLPTLQFGPVLPIIKYSTDEEALARANKSDLGLGGSVWSKDIAKANEMANRIESGTVWVRTRNADLRHQR